MSGEEKAEGQVQEKGGQKKTLLVVAVLCVLVITGLNAALLMAHSSKEEETERETQQTRPVVVNEENVESLVDDLLKDTANVPQSYTASMNSTWVFEDGQSASANAYVGNPAENETAVYFDVIRNDTQETIYQSPVIPLGGHLDNIKLDTDLDAGDYECTLVYHLIDDDQNTLTTVNMWLMVQVEN